jgi:hypothetical protein
MRSHWHHRPHPRGCRTPPSRSRGRRPRAAFPICAERHSPQRYSPQRGVAALFARRHPNHTHRRASMGGYMARRAVNVPVGGTVTTAGAADMARVQATTKGRTRVGRQRRAAHAGGGGGGGRGFKCALKKSQKCSTARPRLHGAVIAPLGPSQAEDSAHAAHWNRSHDSAHPEHAGHTYSLNPAHRWQQYGRPS